ncbi:hypothetical protein TNCV_769361 [Trichonephila clavipes]|nr:hypothetical protein TNCV_769361 [Trichonephila clavipes]
MPSPVQSNYDAHDTIANGQYGAVWSMGTLKQVCVRIDYSNVWQQFFGRSAFLRQQETVFPPAELWCACSVFKNRTYISVFCRRRTKRPPPCQNYTFSSFKLSQP